MVLEGLLGALESLLATIDLWGNWGGSKDL